jgi:hypothetical protein
MVGGRIKLAGPQNENESALTQSSRIRSSCFTSILPAAFSVEVKS